MSLDGIYRVSRSLLDAETWRLVTSLHPSEKAPEQFCETVGSLTAKLGLPGFLADLVRLEWAIFFAGEREAELLKTPSTVAVNPTLVLLELFWKDLSQYFTGKKTDHPGPSIGDETVMVWVDPVTRKVRTERASPEALVSLKIVVEEIDVRDAARLGGTSIGAVDSAVKRAVKKGVLIAPPSGVIRDAAFPRGENIREEFFFTDVFTLQWHITQACDLHCKHCYDRSDRSPLEPDRAFRILDDLHEFCRSRSVSGQISFSGGNPFLYPHFRDLYRAASERGFSLAVLGNPVDRKKVEDLLRIEKPAFFQVSLEGLEKHNDTIRGPGHFRRTIDFLGLLREMRVYSMVMLTLTKDNIGQVIPLADLLRDSVDLFTFNRLALYGEGANLMLPAPEEYETFLEKYLAASEDNPAMALKDNLFNILHYRRKKQLFGGCAGHGCSAALNFLALLPDGEVHACRKFPSLIGNIYRESLSAIYDSEAARRYREGCNSCSSCPIRPVCGGCLAVAGSLGLNIFEDRDPFCFFDKHNQG
jgi:selenobiotic family peptide radical SAM maturase